MGRPMEVKRRVKKIASKRVANKKLNFAGERPTEPFDTENPFSQLTMDTGCGLMCNQCEQFIRGLCYGCYNECSDDIRDCTTKNCDDKTTATTVNAKGELINVEGACGVRCCKRYNLQNWIDNVSRGNGSLSIQDIQWEPFALPNVRPFLPSINGSIFYADIPYAAVSLTKVYSERTDTITERNIREIYQIRPETGLFLTAYCLDPLLESFWNGFRDKGHFHKLKALGFDYAFGFNYSVYHCQPRMEHLINIRRNFDIIQDMQEAGINVVPDLCWHNSADLEQFVQWINKKMVRYVSVSFQKARHNALMARNILDLEFIVNNCPSVKKWFINGPSVPRRIRLLATRIPNMVLMNTRIFQLSKFLQVWDFHCNDWVKCVNPNGEFISRLEAFNRNCGLVEDIVTGTDLERFGDYFSKSDKDIMQDDCDDE